MSIKNSQPDRKKHREHLKQAALDFAERGIPVLPCRPQCKIPKTAHGVNDATTDLSEIRGWWRAWPNANVGIATGSASGIVVIDIDVNDEKGVDGEAALRELEGKHGALPLTREAHMVFMRL